jgi:hypothetical protein
MNFSPLRVSRFSAWAPGFSAGEDWADWARGEKFIEQTKDGPALEYTDPLFRRRLSQISRMTIQVLRDILPIGEKTKIVFVSFRGELSQQFKINKMLIEDADLSPAAFSLSVFNTPPGLAAIALNLRAGYTAVYPAKNDFAPGFLAAAAPVLCGDAEESVLVYADEFILPAYQSICAKDAGEVPLAFAAVLGAKEEGIALPSGETRQSPQAFLKYLFLNKDAKALYKSSRASQPFCGTSL